MSYDSPVARDLEKFIQRRTMLLSTLIVGGGALIIAALALAH